MIPQEVIDYLTGKSPYSMELQCFFMAVQGCMKVRNGANRDRSMSWFHAFCLSVASGYGGGLFTPLWMGLPTPMLSNDACVVSCVLAFLLVNNVPFDLGYKIFSLLPMVVVTTVFAQLFRVTGLVKFVDVAFFAFKDNPSQYYPIPIVGPIAYATLLGNMGPFFVQGFHGWLKDGMPWPFQNGLFCATFYHFYVNDQSGPIGLQLRRTVDMFIPGAREVWGIKDDRTFAFVLVSLFMHLMCLAQLEHCLGPTFSPFSSIFDGAASQVS